MKKEYVCVEANNKEMVGFVFQYEENTMKRMSSRYWETKRYRHRNDDAIYVEKKNASYMATNGQECTIFDSHGLPYYEGCFQYLCSSKWIQEKDYLVCAEYVQDFKIGDIVKLKSKEEPRLAVVENVLCDKLDFAYAGYRNHYGYQLKGDNRLYTINDIQLAFKKDEFTFKRCIKAPRGKLVLNRIYRCCDYNGSYYNYRRVYYESGFSKTLSKEELAYNYRFVDVTLEEYLEQYNAQFEPKQKRERVYSYSKRKEDGKMYRDNFADFINGKACVHINSESDMNWFRLCLQQYGLEHKLTFTYKCVYPKPEYLLYVDDIVRYSFMPMKSMKILEVTDLL